MELKDRLPPTMTEEELNVNLRKIAKMITKLADKAIFPWLRKRRKPKDKEVDRAATIVADRLCGAIADPIIRNLQEERQLSKIAKWLEKRGYRRVTRKKSFEKMKPGEFAIRLNVPGLKEDGTTVNIPVDAVVRPKKAGKPALMIEAKSAGDFTNTNKRRKEEVAKVNQLRKRHRRGIRYILFLCGYFDVGYLEYEAAENIDWVWEHRMSDLSKFGL